MVPCKWASYIQAAPNLSAADLFTPRTPQVLSKVGMYSKSAMAIKRDSLSETEHLLNCIFFCSTV